LCEQRLHLTWPCIRFKVVFVRNPKQEEFIVVAVCGDKMIACVGMKRGLSIDHLDTELTCHNSTVVVAATPSFTA
jgi:hypothetical protein